MNIFRCSAVLAVLMATTGFAQESEVIRARRRLELLGEAGWNGLSGVGVNVGFHVLPHLTIEAGEGLSSVGFKTGLRARANFLTSSWTPFVAGGFLYGTGSMGQEVSVTTDDNTIRFRLLGSPFIQAVAGVEFTGESGFTFLGTAGWAQLLRENFQLVSGTPNDLQRQSISAAYGSGLVLSVAFGYTF